MVPREGELPCIVAAFLLLRSFVACLLVCLLFGASEESEKKKKDSHLLSTRYLHTYVSSTAIAVRVLRALVMHESLIWFHRSAAKQTNNNYEQRQTEDAAKSQYGSLQRKAPLHWMDVHSTGSLTYPWCILQRSGTKYYCS